MKNSTNMMIFRKLFLIVFCLIIIIVSCRNEEPVILGISLDKRDISLQIGETSKLKATVTPSSAADFPIIWTSSNTDVVNVSDGSITAVGLGKATVIAASSTSGGVTATCEVTVSDSVTGISLDKSSLVLYESETDVITATLKTADAESKKVIWTSSADSLVMVSDGRVYAKRAPVDEQPVIITATVVEGEKTYSADCMVTVKCHVSSIKLNKTEFVMEEGDTMKLEVTVLPERATNQDYDIIISDTALVSIDQYNYITAKHSTTSPVIVTVRSKDEVSEGTFIETGCEVTVVKPVDGICITYNGNEVRDLVLCRGSQAALNARLTPDGVTNPKVNWTSSNAEVATIDAEGVISSAGTGYTTIIATSEDGGKTASCILRVVVPLDKIVMEDIEGTLYEGDQKNIIIKYIPNDATVDSAGWKSSDISTATVSPDGTVTAIRSSSIPVKFSFTAKAFTKDGTTQYFTAESSRVSVACHPSSVRLNTNSTVLKCDESIQLSAKVLPDRATNKSVSWSSTNTAVATVSPDGKVTAKAISNESVYIVATTVDGSLKDSCEITVVKYVSGISILSDGQKVDSVSIEKEKSKYFTFKLEPEDAMAGTVSWESTNENVATVSADRTGATITARRAGYTTLIVKSSVGAMIAWCKIRVVVPLTGISFDKTSKSLYEGETDSINVTFTPKDATDKALLWKSSDESSVVVFGGRIVAIKAKSSPVTITAETPDGKFKGTCSVNVKVNKSDGPTSVTLNRSSLTLKKRDSFQLVATVEPESARDKSVSWESSEPTVVSVDAKGLVTALADGYAKITAETVNHKKAECYVSVTESVIEVTSVSITPSSVTVDKGKTVTLTAKISPDNATDKNLTWSSDQPGIAKVDKFGTVTGVSVGKAEISACSTNGKCSKCTVSVIQPKVSVKGLNIEVDPHDERYDNGMIYLYVGEDFQLNAVVVPADATNKAVSWEVVGGYVTVNDGKLTAAQYMSNPYSMDIVTARSVDNPSVKKSVTVKVLARLATGVSINKSAFAMMVNDSERLYPVFTPVNTTDQSGTWTSDNPDVITVGPDGTVTAMSAGKATITFTSTDGAFKGYCNITVKESSAVESGEIQGIAFDEL